MRLPIQVLVYPARNIGSGWEYLMLRRVPKLGGHWQGVTGGIEEGEELTDAAIRELAEETGLVPSTLEQINYSYSFPLLDKWRYLYTASVDEILEHVFIAVVDVQQDPIISWEHDKYQWCSLSQAIELLTYSENIEALKRCDLYVKSRLT